jgi:hypothetical protein
MQTAEPGTFPTSTAGGYNFIKNKDGNAGFFRGIKPLWGR